MMRRLLPTLEVPFRGPVADAAQVGPLTVQRKREHERREKDRLGGQQQRRPDDEHAGSCDSGDAQIAGEVDRCGSDERGDQGTAPVDEGERGGERGHALASPETMPDGEVVAQRRTDASPSPHQRREFAGKERAADEHRRNDLEDIAGEVDRIISLGLHGVKLHSDFQKTALDSPKSYRIYEAIEGRLPVLVHMGDYRHDYSHPTMLVKVMRDFPKLKVLASHLGGFAAWDEAEAVLRGSDNIRFDTSSAVCLMSPERAIRLIRHYGVERCMFGTDFPMWDPKQEAERLLSLGFTFEEYQKLFAGNAKEFLNIP